MIKKYKEHFQASKHFTTILEYRILGLILDQYREDKPEIFIPIKRIAEFSKLTTALVFKKAKKLVLNNAGLFDGINLGGFGANTIKVSVKKPENLQDFIEIDERMLFCKSSNQIKIYEYLSKNIYSGIAEFEVPVQDIIDSCFTDIKKYEPKSFHRSIIKVALEEINSRLQIKITSKGHNNLITFKVEEM